VTLERISFTFSTVYVQRFGAVRRLQHSSAGVKVFDDVPVVHFGIRTDTSCHQLPQHNAVRPLRQHINSRDQDFWPSVRDRFPRILPVRDD